MPPGDAHLGMTLRTDRRRALENRRSTRDNSVEGLWATAPRPADDATLIPTPRAQRWQPCDPLGITNGQRNPV